MTGAIPYPSYRLRPLMAAICLGAASLLAAPVFSGPALARGPDGIADVAEKVIDAVVNISTSQTVEAKGRIFRRRAGRDAATAAGLAIRGILRRFFQEPPRRSGRRLQGRRGAAAQDQLARLRLHRRHLGYCRDQQSRHRGCRRDQHHHERRHQDQGRAGRRRQEDRSCGAEVQAAGEAAGCGEVRRFREAAARRMGDRDRQSVQPRRHGHCRHRLGAQPRHQHRPL